MDDRRRNNDDVPEEITSPLPDEAGRLGAGREPDDGAPPAGAESGWGARPGRGPAGSGDESGLVGTGGLAPEEQRRAVDLFGGESLRPELKSGQDTGEAEGGWPEKDPDQPPG